MELVNPTPDQLGLILELKHLKSLKLTNANRPKSVDYAKLDKMNLKKLHLTNFEFSSSDQKLCVENRFFQHAGSLVLSRCNFCALALCGQPLQCSEFGCNVDNADYSTHIVQPTVTTGSFNLSSGADLQFLELFPNLEHLTLESLKALQIFDPIEGLRLESLKVVGGSAFDCRLLQNSKLASLVLECGAVNTHLLSQHPIRELHLQRVTSFDFWQPGLEKLSAGRVDGGLEREICAKPTMFMAGVSFRRVHFVDWNELAISHLNVQSVQNHPHLYADVTSVRVAKTVKELSFLRVFEKMETLDIRGVELASVEDLKLLKVDELYCTLGLEQLC